jgi:hypothetical protein
MEYVCMCLWKDLGPLFTFQNDRPACLQVDRWGGICCRELFSFVTRQVSLRALLWLRGEHRASKRDRGSDVPYWRGHLWREVWKKKRKRWKMFNSRHKAPGGGGGRGSVEVKALCNKLEGCGFDTRWDAWSLSVYQILPATLVPWVYSASNRN